MSRTPRHERLARISKMLADGMSKTEIAKALGISRKTLYQDMQLIEEQAVEVLQEKPALVERVVQSHIDVVEQLRDANRVAWELLESFKHDKPFVALGALERIQDQLTLQAKLIGLLTSGTQINILQIQNFSREVFEVIQEVACPVCKERILQGLKERRARYREGG
ncbi:MAG: helix-turn-helix domain-containing protein [Bacillota bacterium]|nr:helix-turn-helix domain-containing protein [Bacillota bacterium]